ncbi:CDP-alcohol phosphatidyltransferase family protein [Candidatus Micrarchaeota archaeon]|nr:CDP-alcohol phosphatidyltransferase family protein [Candidatus Micrarchaeota archaeon]
MLKSNFSSFTDRVSIKLGIFFSRIPISPNAWTVLAIVPALIGFYFLVNKEMLYAIVAFVISGVIDGIDGGVARVTGRVTALGAYLDGIVDRFVEALLLFGLLFYGLVEYFLPAYVWVALLLFFGTVMTSYTRAYADHRKAIGEEDIRKMPGLLERPERLILIFLGMVASFYHPVYLTHFMIAATLLSVVTVLQRIFYVYSKAARS